MIQDQSHRAAGLEALAARHGVSVEAATHMLRALQAGGGTMAQFDHPEFGGMGQWFSGGMVMVGRMNDHALKARVSGLCEELAAILPTLNRQAGAASSSQSQSQSSGFGGFAAFGPGDWWPDGLGRPASVGAQNATRYAYFPESRRLAVESNGQVALYDTGEHVITGASQQQSGTSSFVFSGPNGTVSLDALKRVEAGERDRVEAKGRELHLNRFEGMPEELARPTPPAPRPDAPAASAPSPSASPSPAAAPQGQSDVLSVLERLAELHRKGVLTDAEFSGKKAELLARL